MVGLVMGMVVIYFPLKVICAGEKVMPLKKADVVVIKGN